MIDTPYLVTGFENISVDCDYPLGNEDSSIQLGGIEIFYTLGHILIWEY